MNVETGKLSGLQSGTQHALLKTAAIEVLRSNQQAVPVSLHPGTVNTGLSKP